MKTKKQVKQALKDAALSTDEMELWDGEPEMHVNKGWHEALLWVLHMKKGKRYNYGQNKDKSSGFSIEKGL